MKNTIGVSFEMPKDLHTQVKIKLAPSNGKINHYIISLIEKDLAADAKKKK